MLSGRDLRSLSFSGAATLPPLPLLWTVVSNDPDRAGNPVLWSGNENNLDSAAITSVAVPTADPTLRFLAKYGAEFGFDYAYVVVSTDGGETYTPIPGDRTIDAPLGPGAERHHDRLRAAHLRPLGIRRAECAPRVPVRQRRRRQRGWPAGRRRLRGRHPGQRRQQPGSVRLADRDPPGLRAQLERPADRPGRGEGVRPAGRVRRQLSITLARTDLGQFSPFGKVVALVAYDEPTEQVQQYAPYTLTVNGVVQPGGGGS